MSSSIVKRFQDNVNKCDICFSQYDRITKQPVMICSLHHTICKQCLKSVQIKQQCPFCREKIKFDKVVINNYIFELLPQVEEEPNRRIEVTQQYNNQMPRQLPFNGAGVNARPIQHIYPQNYQPLQPRYEVNDYIPQNYQYLQDFQDQQQFTDSPCQRIIYRLRLNTQQERKLLYVSVFLLQLPFLICDLSISLTAQQSQCMDTPHQSGAYILRPWLLSMGICEAGIMLILLLAASFRVCQIISFKVLIVFEWIVVGLLMVRILLWCYIQLAIFSVDIAPHCNGGIFAYGIVLTILHGILLLGLCCLSICGKQ